MPFVEELKEMVLEGASNLELKNAARRTGMKTLRESGMQKIREGLTTVEEICRVTAPDEDPASRKTEMVLLDEEDVYAETG